MQIKAEERTFRHAQYSKGIVVKPWGYEYLWFELGNSAGWVLWLGPDDNTSMHCHAAKTTALIVISGEPEISGFTFSVRPKIGEIVYIEPACFHKTKNLSSEHPLCVMEIETPIDKQDLFRSSDGYGRNHSKYEAIDSWGDDPRGLNKYRRAAFFTENQIFLEGGDVSSGYISEIYLIQYSIRYRKKESVDQKYQSWSVNIDAILQQCKEIGGDLDQTTNQRDDIIISWKCLRD